NKLSNYPAYPYLAILNTSNYEWTAPKAINSIGPVAKHTSIIIENYMILAFGVNVTDDEFIRNIYKMDISNPSIYKWSLLSRYNDYYSLPGFLEYIYNRLIGKIIIIGIVFLVMAIVRFLVVAIVGFVGFLFKNDRNNVTSNQSDYGSITPV
ncbi:1382_t:CDS:2, partial [Dentiscutata heterogama]